MGFIADWGISIFLSRLFAIRPQIKKQGNTLVATSNWRTLLFTLGAMSRRVVVDPASKTVRIRARIFWFFVKTRRIQFDWIEQILYSYGDMSTGSVVPWAGGYRESDCFTVALELKNREHVALFRFVGDGHFVNESFLPDWLYWDDILLAKITRGSQEDESLVYADLLSRMIGVPLGNPEP